MLLNPVYTRSCTPPTATTGLRTPGVRLCSGDRGDFAGGALCPDPPSGAGAGPRSRPALRRRRSRSAAARQQRAERSRWLLLPPGGRAAAAPSVARNLRAPRPLHCPPPRPRSRCAAPSGPNRVSGGAVSASPGAQAGD